MRRCKCRCTAPKYIWSIVGSVAVASCVGAIGARGVGGGGDVAAGWLAALWDGVGSAGGTSDGDGNKVGTGAFDVAASAGGGAGFGGNSGKAAATMGRLTRAALGGVAGAVAGTACGDA